MVSLGLVLSFATLHVHLTHWTHIVLDLPFPSTFYTHTVYLLPLPPRTFLSFVHWMRACCTLLPLHALHGLRSGFTGPDVLHFTGHAHAAVLDCTPHQLPALDMRVPAAPLCGTRSPLHGSLPHSLPFLHTSHETPGHAWTHCTQDFSNTVCLVHYWTISRPATPFHACHLSALFLNTGFSLLFAAPFSPFSFLDTSFLATFFLNIFYLLPFTRFSLFTGRLHFLRLSHQTSAFAWVHGFHAILGFAHTFLLFCTYVHFLTFGFIRFFSRHVLAMPHTYTGSLAFMDLFFLFLRSLDASRTASLSRTTHRLCHMDASR